MWLRKEPLLLLRSLRIGCILILILYIWSSAAGTTTTVVTTTSTSGVGTYYEVDAGGHVLVRTADASTTAGLLLEGLSQPQKQQQQQQQQRRQEENILEDPGLLLSRDETTTTTKSSSPSASREHLDKDDECGLYLAPSTIEGAGLGIFSSRPRKIGETVGYEELVIPMVEVPFYNGDKAELFNPFVHYYWKGAEKGLHGIVAEHRENEVQGFVPGLDAATNCNLALINVDMSGSKFDNSDLNRNHDPMAGAMTPYHTTPSAVVRDVPAGGELFKFYGDRWFMAREDKFGVIPLYEDYPAAQKIISKFDRLRQDHFETNPQLNQELWSLIKDTIGGTTMWESRIMKALPKGVEDAQQAAQHDITSLYQPQAIRSNTFLQQHGRCMDSIRPGKSTLESGQGGRGAFATRSFVRGDILTGTPLHHVPNKELVTIYRMELNQTTNNDNDNSDNAAVARDKQEHWIRKVDEIVGYQMMLNYCYGHAESTLLLCPYGSNIGYINHNQTRANVKIQWAPDGLIKHNHTWLLPGNKRIEDMEFDYQVNLAFDYVATRDIQEGEEIFLDYGDEFERALTNHMFQWQPTPPPAQGGTTTTTKDYTPAEIFNTNVANSTLRTEAEQSQEPYPENVETRCHPGLVHKEIRASDQATNGDWIWETREIGYPCRILERYNDDDDNNNNNSNKEVASSDESLYKVELKLPLNEVGRQYVKDKFNYVQKKNVRRSAVVFFNKPYTTDLFLPNTFRKEIGIPDDIFPDHWKNKKP